MTVTNLDTKKLVAQQTQNWVKDFIVAHNICPFARNELEKNRIQYEVFKEGNLEGSLTTFIQLCDRLENDDSIETALFIYADALKDFNHYLDILDVANSLLVEQGYEGIYQLASFHPEYCFEGSELDDASNFTNRSPYPMLHIIREQSLEKVLENYPHPEQIPQRNIEYCRKLGSEQLAEILNFSLVI